MREMIPRRLGAVAALKFIALLFIYWWHCPLPKPHTSLGGTMCTFLFVASGFLVAHQYLDRDIDLHPRNWFRYALDKFLTAWPLHVTMFVVCVMFLNASALTLAHRCLIALSNLMLLHAWIPKKAFFFSFNGVTWFLSALLPCYLLALPMVVFCRRRLGALSIFCGSSLLFVLFVLAVRSKVLPFHVVLHVSPISHFLQFCIGVASCGLCHGLATILQDRRHLVSLLEFGALILFLGISWWIRDVYSVFYSLLFAGVLVVFSVDEGVVSRCLRWKPVQALAQCQFEFFVIHQVVIRLFSHFFHRWIRLQHHAGRQGICVAYILIEFMAALALAMLWHWVFAGAIRNWARGLSGWGKASENETLR